MNDIRFAFCGTPLKANLTFMRFHIDNLQMAVLQWFCHKLLQNRHFGVVIFAPIEWGQPHNISYSLISQYHFSYFLIFGGLHKNGRLFFVFWDNFFSLCSQAGISPNAVAKELGIPSGSITAWSRGSVPRNNTLKKIAEHFGVSVDWLLGKSDKEKKPLATADEELAEYLEMLRTRPEMRMLFRVSKDATKADVEKAVAIVEALRKTEG